MKNNSVTLLAIALTLIGAGCANTQIVSTWKEPGVTAAAFHRVLVISPSRDEGTRRRVEDALANRLSGNVQGVPAYRLLGLSQLQDREQVKQVVRANGFDGVIVFRVVSVEKHATWVPGMYAGPAYAYGGWGYYDPGYMQ